MVTVDFIPGELDGGGAGGALPAGCGGPRVRLDGRRSLSTAPRRNHRGENLEFKYSLPPLPPAHSESESRIP